MLLVRDVLWSDGNPIVKFAEDEAIGSAAALMHFAGLPALVLVDRRRRATALLTARDIVTFFARAAVEGASGPPSRARAAINDPLRLCESRSPLARIVEEMAGDDLQAILVVDEGAEIGVLTVESIAAALRRVAT